MVMPPNTADASPDATGLPDRPSAIALSYAKKDRAPIVVAKGYGAVADSIVQRARESGLYVHASPDLVKLLMQVNLDEQIPPQLYLAVAEVLAWLYRLDAQKSKK
ncbi:MULTISPECIES: EscU/YscU/HrcU family type III secretion system export apparatus switch protein [unclassified Polaromonas]|uniref:EscU/YscU/HrcU family type III secretion system export apparatus switch protein n=2 Tax=Polaromonas TaxID=52972 RepID=UPI0018CA6DD0|nr:flagellar biosynthesis protein [Polaromonas sp. CG_9.7]MDH6184147.1 flagellar biosynthesis protein [Polaromonas sp. CG_23.6]